MKSIALILVGFSLGVLVTFGFVNSTLRLPPEPPFVPRPESITVILHPWDGIEPLTNKAISIPTEIQEEVFRRLVPETYFGIVDEHITPIVAEAVITHAYEKQTRILVRHGGKNPAVVSVDGVNYFYAKNESDVHAGATELFGLVEEVAYNQEKHLQSK
jgi:hypothetical protein